MAHKMGVMNGAKIRANTYSRREHNTRKAAESTCGDIYVDAAKGEGIDTPEAVRLVEEEEIMIIIWSTCMFCLCSVTLTVLLVFAF
ncbi:MAG: hypothetical protein NPIRA03_13670 [Nitrospirales bacterium]|nr:MAG: hypothetical protein NPIRA03_13670 [Nitrospirales bacterium]